jgi:hypothetical protein
MDVIVGWPTNALGEKPGPSSVHERLHIRYKRNLIVNHRASISLYLSDKIFYWKTEYLVLDVTSLFSSRRSILDWLLALEKGERGKKESILRQRFFMYMN